MARASRAEHPVLPGMAMDSHSIGWIEREAVASGFSWILGVDEVGRGPLAGPVTTAAVLLRLDDYAWCEGLDDSKKLTKTKREAWIERIRSRCVASHLHHVPVEEVDAMNVLGASLHGMRLCALEVLKRVSVDLNDVLVVVDGKQELKAWEGRQRAVVKGDASSFAIAAASVLAKVTRDRWMTDLAALYPGYGFEDHAGYGTRAHMDALSRLGVTPHHRRSFAPIKALLAEDERS